MGTPTPTARAACCFLVMDKKMGNLGVLIYHFALFQQATHQHWRHDGGQDDAPGDGGIPATPTGEFAQMLHFCNMTFRNHTYLVEFANLACSFLDTQTGMPMIMAGTDMEAWKEQIQICNFAN